MAESSDSVHRLIIVVPAVHVSDLRYVAIFYAGNRPMY